MNQCQEITSLSNTFDVIVLEKTFHHRSMSCERGMYYILVCSPRNPTNAMAL